MYGGEQDAGYSAGDRALSDPLRRYCRRAGAALQARGAGDALLSDLLELLSGGAQPFSLVLMAGKAGAGRDGPVARCAVIVRMPAVSPNSRL